MLNVIKVIVERRLYGRFVNNFLNIAFITIRLVDDQSAVGLEILPLAPVRDRAADRASPTARPAGWVL